jgi:hypothetical protein
VSWQLCFLIDFGLSSKEGGKHGGGTTDYQSPFELDNINSEYTREGDIWGWAWSVIRAVEERWMDIITWSWEAEKAMIKERELKHETTRTHHTTKSTHRPKQLTSNPHEMHLHKERRVKKEMESLLARVKKGGDQHMSEFCHELLLTMIEYHGKYEDLTTELNSLLDREIQARMLEAGF